MFFFDCSYTHTYIYQHTITYMKNINLLEFYNVQYEVYKLKNEEKKL